MQQVAVLYLQTTSKPLKQRMEDNSPFEQAFLQNGSNRKHMK